MILMKWGKTGGTGASLQRFLLKTILLAASVLLLFTCVFKVRRARGNEMYPSVRDGDLCIFLNVRLIPGRDSQGVCSAGEVLLFRDKEGKRRIGRVTAQGGQEVDFPEHGGYTVDGYELLEEIPYATYPAENSEVTFPLQLGEQQLFLMNDFRTLTDDSRSFGPVDEDQAEGRLLFLLRRRGF